jgi:hypothetical protein
VVFDDEDAGPFWRRRRVVVFGRQRMSGYPHTVRTAPV